MEATEVVIDVNESPQYHKDPRHGKQYLIMFRTESSGILGFQVRFNADNFADPIEQAREENAATFLRPGYSIQGDPVNFSEIAKMPKPQNGFRLHRNLRRLYA